MLYEANGGLTHLNRQLEPPHYGQTVFNTSADNVQKHKKSVEREPDVVLVKLSCSPA